MNIALRKISQTLRVVCITAVMLSCISCASLSQKSRFDELFDTPSFTAARWGASVKSVESGAFIYRLDDTKAFTPASNMKLFTTAVALVRLGPEFRFATELYTNGEIRDGILHGDLVVRGSGDPTLSTGVFEKWAEQLRAAGIREIRGALIGDDNVFDDQYLGTGWSWDDAAFGYAAQISGLSFSDNSVGIEILPGRTIGGPAILKTAPDTGYVTVSNQVITAPPGNGPNALRFSREPGSNRIIVMGEISAQSPALYERISVHNPTHFAVAAFKEIMEAKGIHIAGDSVDIDDIKMIPDYPSMKKIALHFSQPLYEIIRATNKLSRNIYAEQIFRTLGKVIGGEGSTARSAAVVKETLSSMGIPTDAFAVYDGSGLSRLNLATPLQIVLLLDAMAKHEYFKYFYDSLPVAGVDGTLEWRMKNTGAEKNLHAKTGYFQQVRALSGYTTTKEGEMIAFSIMANNHLGSPTDTRVLQDRFCEVLSGLPRSR